MENRQHNIEKLTRDLCARFNERVFCDRKKADKLQRLHPKFIDEYYKKWEKFDELAKQYLDGKIEWDGTPSVQLELNSVGEPVHSVKNPETVKGFSRDFYCWFMAQTGAL